MPTITADSPLWDRLQQSSFRRRFKLSGPDLIYAQKKGPHVIAEHAADFIQQRLAAADPKHDGKQTPWRGHPVFVAQHATATCCRSCMEKWHHIPKHTALSAEQQQYVQNVIMMWLVRQHGFDTAPTTNPTTQPDLFDS